MTIVGLITHLDSGGAQIAMLRLMRQLRARGHDMEVIALYRSVGDQETDPHVHVLLDENRPGIWGYLQIVARLFQALRQRRPEAVVSFLPLACALGQFVARLVGIPTRIASQRNPGWTYSPAMRWADLVIGSTGFYSRNIAVSQSVIESFEAYPRAYRDRLERIHNGIEWQASQRSAEDARESFGLASKPCLLVALGRLSEQKNYPPLLRALTAVPDASLAVAGEGPLRNELAELAASLGIAERVRFLGQIDRTEVPDLLRSADVFVQPSLYEGQSNALLEALCEGLPIVASDIPPQRETLVGPDGTQAGLLLPASDSEAWTAALNELVKDPERRAELGEQARLRARAFTVEAMAESFERCLLAVAGGRAGSHG